MALSSVVWFGPLRHLISIIKFRTLLIQKIWKDWMWLNVLITSKDWQSLLISRLMISPQFSKRLLTLMVFQAIKRSIQLSLHAYLSHSSSVSCLEISCMEVSWQLLAFIFASQSGYLELWLRVLERPDTFSYLWDYFPLTTELFTMIIPQWELKCSAKDATQPIKLKLAK